ELSGFAAVLEVDGSSLGDRVEEHAQRRGDRHLGHGWLSSRKVGRGSRQGFEAAELAEPFAGGPTLEANRGDRDVQRGAFVGGETRFGQVVVLRANAVA